MFFSGGNIFYYSEQRNCYIGEKKGWSSTRIKIFNVWTSEISAFEAKYQSKLGVEVGAEVYMWALRGDVVK